MTKKHATNTGAPKNKSNSVMRYSSLQQDAPGGKVQRLGLWVRKHRAEVILVAILLVISFAAHSWNMLHFPYVENDEATYTSRAWAFITEGRLDVYTYRYDHAPLGWITIGLWQLITGGHAFMSLITSGRIFMLLIHVCSALMLYIITKRLSGGSKFAGTVAVLVFSLSPLAIYFQRRILLDNLMVFWMMASLYVASRPRHRMKDYFLSAIFFGIGVLTKLNAIFFIPAYLFLVWRKAHKDHRMHALLYWMFVAGSVIAAFFVYALLKGELFSAPLDANGMPTHVSVVDTFKLQLGRGDFAWPWKHESSFWQNVLSWTLKDHVILILGSVATIAGTTLAFVRRKRYPLAMTIMVGVLAYVAFLARGKLVIDLYIVPLIPFIAASLGITLAMVRREYAKHTFVSRYMVISSLLILGLLVAQQPTRQYTNNETSNQMATLTWIENNIPKDATIAADNYVYPYLASERGYQHVSYFFSTEYDPEVRKTYGDDWRNIDYIILSHEIVQQIKTGTIPKMRDTLEHATLLADFRDNTTSYIDLPHYISTNGDWSQVYKVKSRDAIVRQDSWQHFKDTFMISYGQIVDITNGELTSSYGQASAMLRAVQENDKDAFSGIWQWSKDHLRYRSTDKLLSWKWEKTADGSYKLGDSNNVCGADQTIAYALYKAADKWPGTSFAEEASKHTDDWWKKCTFTIGNLTAIDSSADGSRDSRLLNMGYFNPTIYHYLATKKPGLNWNDLISDQYAIVGSVNKAYGHVPDWVIVNPNGTIGSADSIIGSSSSKFGLDSIMLAYNLSQEYAQTKDQRALQALQQMKPSLDAYTAETKNAPSHVASLLYAQVTGSVSRAEIQKQYQQYINKPYDHKTGKWADGYNYLDHVWYWQWYAMQQYIEPSRQVELQ